MSPAWSSQKLLEKHVGNILLKNLAVFVFSEYYKKDTCITFYFQPSKWKCDLQWLCEISLHNLGNIPAWSFLKLLEKNIAEEFCVLLTVDIIKRIQYSLYFFRNLNLKMELKLLWIFVTLLIAQVRHDLHLKNYRSLLY